MTEQLINQNHQNIHIGITNDGVVNVQFFFQNKRAVSPFLLFVVQHQFFLKRLQSTSKNEWNTYNRDSNEYCSSIGRS